MAELTTLHLQDRPIENEQEDFLDRGPFIGGLIRALIREQRNQQGDVVVRTATGYVVGLVGRWGLGKSSILRLLSLKLSAMDEVVVVTFNPWLFKGRDELLRAFFGSMREALGRTGGERGRALVTSLDRYWAAIDWAGKTGAAYADLHGGVGMVSKGWSLVSSLGRAKIRKGADRSLDADRKALEERLLISGVAVVVLIDELDRVEDEEVRAVAQLIKAIGDIKGVSYLVAYDQHRVVDALGRGSNADERRDSGASYLEKIIQHPIPLRPLFPEDVDILLTAALADHGLKLDTGRSEQAEAILTQLKAEITTPRDVKRLVGSFAVLEAMVRGEIDPTDVLAYCWILVKSPALRDAIEGGLAQVVDDPDEIALMDRLMRRMDREKGPPSAVDALGPAAVGHEKLLGLLFPTLLKNGEAGHGERLSRRRNLVRLLYLGNPPGMVRRAEIEKLWTLDDAVALEIELKLLQEQGRLLPLVDRLEDLLPTLPTDGDVTFWPVLARLLIRPQDWAKAADSRQNLADDVGTAILRLGLRNGTNIPRVRRTMEALITAGDLTVVPLMLRKQLFAHGLTRHGSSSKGDSILTKEETEEMLDREMPRYRAAVLNGTALRRLPNVELLYVIGNMSQWDEELRTSFTSQLEGLEALGTMATLLVPPGYSSERSHLDELFDAELVAQRIDAEVIAHGWPDDLWVKSSLQRLRLFLAGKDPHFYSADDGACDVPQV